MICFSWKLFALNDTLLYKGWLPCLDSLSCHICREDTTLSEKMYSRGFIYRTVCKWLIRQVNQNNHTGSRNELHTTKMHVFCIFKFWIQLKWITYGKMLLFCLLNLNFENKTIYTATVHSWCHCRLGFVIVFLGHCLVFGAFSLL